MESEVPLTGGRVTAGVVRIGDTVRRPAGPNATFVRELLGLLAAREFEAAPRYLGSDDQGREIFSFPPGDVPPDLNPNFSDETLASAARLIRRFHDVTAGTQLAGDCEVVCHNDLSPCNFVFRAERPAGIIDFDSAAPGERLHDVGYALFLWLNLGTDGPPASEQARRIGAFCAAYGINAGETVVDAIVAAAARNVEELRRAGRIPDVVWWQAQLDWLAERRRRLER